MRFILLSLVSCWSLYYQASPRLSDNSIGLAYLIERGDQHDLVKVVFPTYRVENQLSTDSFDWETPLLYKFQFEGEISFFNSEGIFWELKKRQEFEMNFWCHNDGGVQFRPSTILKIPKHVFKEIQSIGDLNDVISFVVVNYDTIAPIDFPVRRNADIRMLGDLNNDGKPEARLWSRISETDCDQPPSNELLIVLDANKEWNLMRCCGP